MATRRTMLKCLLLVTAIPLTGVDALALDHFSPRQYYSNWSKHPTANYNYRRYYYKPTPQFTGFKHHYVVHHPAKPKHVYFYNPYKKQYWGRCEVSTNGKPQYSMLKLEDRRGTLKEIPESAFPPPSPVPTIPESEDGVPLDLPPDDLPGIDTAPPSE